MTVTAQAASGLSTPDGQAHDLKTDVDALIVQSNADSARLDAMDAVSTDLDGNAAVDADALVIPITARHVSKTTGGDAEALTLANGAAGQMLTITLVTDGGGDGTLTPATATGWATVVLADAGDIISLLFVDATVGWVILGTAGVSAPPVITV